MPLFIERNNINRTNVDAIVLVAGPVQQGGAGGALHMPRQPEEGRAKIIKSRRHPRKYGIRALGPVYIDGSHGEGEVLASCIRSAMALARRRRCKTAAFLIFGYPADQAMHIAVNVLGEAMLKTDMTVYIYVSGYEIGETGWAKFADVEKYIDDHYEGTHTGVRDQGIRQIIMPAEKPFRGHSSRDRGDVLGSDQCSARAFSGVESTTALYSAQERKQKQQIAMSVEIAGLDEALRQMDESFTQMLLRKIDEKGMKDSECYKKANIDRKLFSKIRSDIHYKPSKSTVLAFAIALELPLAETQDMLTKAGFALSHSNKFDIIVEYFIRRGKYNIFEINEALFAFDQSLLGA